MSGPVSPAEDPKNQGYYGQNQRRERPFLIQWRPALIVFMDFQGKLVVSRLWLLAGGHIVGNSLLFVNSQVAGIGAHKAFVEDAAGEKIEFFLLERLQGTP